MATATETMQGTRSGQLLTLSEVCGRLRVKRGVLNRLIREGRFPRGFRLGGPRSPLRWHERVVDSAVEALADEAAQ